MASFLDILTASEEQLVNLVCRMKPGTSEDFLFKINHAAAQLGLNHSQLVCALGFNKNIRDLTDVLSVVGFASYKLLSYRRDELFSHDTYGDLSVDNVLDIYSERIEDEQVLGTLRGLLSPRFSNIEAGIGEAAEPQVVFSYKMEIHAVYASGIATTAFAEQRAAQDIGRFRLLTDEIQMIVEQGLIPASNLFFTDSLLPDEKKFLIESGEINDAMIRNRLQNPEISAEERDLLEDCI
jgi:hypothetical protein